MNEEASNPIDTMGVPSGGCNGLLDQRCGFPWYKVSKLEHQLVSLRHVQHHAAQLADRLRAEVDHGVRWVGARPVS